MVVAMVLLEAKMEQQVTPTNKVRLVIQQEVVGEATMQLAEVIQETVALVRLQAQTRMEAADANCSFLVGVVVTFEFADKGVLIVVNVV